MGPVLVAGLSFVVVAGLIFALWWAFVSEREGALQARMTSRGMGTAASASSVLTTTARDLSPLGKFATFVPGMRQLEELTEQAGWHGKSDRALALIALFTFVGGAIGFLRMNHWMWGILWAAAFGVLPILYLRYLRQKRLDKFSEQFPDALDMMTRALRTGYAVGPAFQLVGEDMPDPVATEFRRVSDQISLGRPTTEALLEMYGRIRSEDVRFFYVAVGIQREVGGNLAEILEKLSEVIRERFKLLAFAQVLSAQQKAAAYCVGASPFVTALLLVLRSPEWFDPLWKWPYGTYAVLGCLALMVCGFLVLRRIANITV